MRRIFALILLLCVTTTNGYAVMIGDFLGLQRLVDRSDAIVILRIDKHIDYQSGPTLYTTHLCYIYQTLKGDIPKGERISLRLMDTRTNFITPFVVGSTHLMFLTKKRAKDEPTDYRTIESQGANIRLSPFGHERMPKGETLEEKIRFLIKESIKYWNKENKKEERFLDLILGQ